MLIFHDPYKKEREALQRMVYEHNAQFTHEVKDKYVSLKSAFCKKDAHAEAVMLLRKNQYKDLRDYSKDPKKLHVSLHEEARLKSGKRPAEMCLREALLKTY
jgi:hypothetical protein